MSQVAGERPPYSLPRRRAQLPGAVRARALAPGTSGPPALFLFFWVGSNVAVARCCSRADAAPRRGARAAPAPRRAPGLQGRGAAASVAVRRVWPRCLGARCAAPRARRAADAARARRVCIVNSAGAVLLDRAVAQAERVTDYRTRFSGIRPRDLAGAPPLSEARRTPPRKGSRAVAWTCRITSTCFMGRLLTVRSLSLMGRAARCGPLHRGGRHSAGAVSHAHALQCS